MSQRDWRRQLAAFITGNPNGQLSYWDINRVVASITLHAAVVFFLIGAVLSIWSIYESDRESYRKYQQQSEADSKKAAQEIASECQVLFNSNPAFVECLAKQIWAHQKQDNTNQDLRAQQDVANWAFWTVIVGSLSLAIGIGGLWALVMSLRQTRQAITNDREIGQSQIRAYVSVSTVNPIPPIVAVAFGNERKTRYCAVFNTTKLGDGSVQLDLVLSPYHNDST